jgi:hypothetical protein
MHDRNQTQLRLASYISKSVQLITYKKFAECFTYVQIMNVHNLNT